MEEMEIRINELMLEKDIEALRPAEQEMVLAHMSEAEYSARRAVLLESQAMFAADAAHIVPDPNLLFSLREAQRRSTNKRGVLAALLLYRIPAYQVGLAAVLLLFFWFGLRSTPEPTPTPTVAEVIYQSVHDTIEVVKEVVVEVPVERIVTVVQYKEPPLLAAVALSSDAMQNGITPPAAAPDIDAVVRSFGNSSVDPEQLEQFRVVGI